MIRISWSSRPFGELLDHSILMLSRYMYLELLNLHFLPAFIALKKSVFAIFFQMDVQIPFFDRCAALQGASHLKLVHDFAQAHIDLTGRAQFLLAAWAYLRISWQKLEAIEADDSATLLTVKWFLRQFVATYAFENFVSQLLHVIRGHIEPVLCCWTNILISIIILNLLLHSFHLYLISLAKDLFYVVEI